MARNENILTNQNDKLKLGEESKDFDEEILDDALMNALKGEHKQFTLQIEKAMNLFIASNKTTETLQNLDKYQRKIVHKICDLYGIKREYVDVKQNDFGDITLTKTIESKIPAVSLEKTYLKIQDDQKKKSSKEKKKNPLANKKVLIKPRIVQKSSSGESESSEGSGGENGQREDSPTQTEVEQKKQQEYEQARNRIMEENSTPTIENVPQQTEKPKKKGLKVGQVFDPDYVRDMAPPVSINNFGAGVYAYPQFYPNQFQNQFSNGFYQVQNYQNQNDQFYSNEFPTLAMNGTSQKKK